jgi:hypothetical protein
MAGKRRIHGRPQVLSRDVEISSLRATVRLDAVHRRGEDPYVESQPWLELRGAATQPVREVRDVVISTYPVDAPQIGTARPASVGAVIQARPCLGFVLVWPRIDSHQSHVARSSIAVKFRFGLCAARRDAT